MQGFLNLNKPFGFTSHDCVAKTRRLFKLKRIGHAGTLDPAATGVLPIALGRATRLLQFLPQDKAYRATIRLGISTITDDLQGEALLVHPVPELDLETVKTALRQFQGCIQQVPPSYSAIQVKGKRLYELARKGEDVVVPARSIEVFRTEVLDWRPGEFPELDVAIACGPGTYIRAIARDLGKFLQTGGTLAALVRTTSSGFSLTDSLTLENLESQLKAGTFYPVSPEKALAHLPAVFLASDQARRWCQGQRVFINQSTNQTLDHISEPGEPEKHAAALEQADTDKTVSLRVHHQEGRFLGIGLPVTESDGIVLKPQVVLESVG